MPSAIHILIGSDKINLSIISAKKFLQSFTFDNFEAFENKFDELNKNGNYPINICLDNSSLKLESDYLVSITNSGFVKAIKAKLEKSYQEGFLVGYFIVEEQSARQFEKKIFLVNISQENLIEKVLDKVKKLKNSILSISCLTIELQHICSYIKEQRLEIIYDKNEFDNRNYNEFDVFAFKTNLGGFRYIIYKNSVFLNHEVTANSSNELAEFVSGIMSNDILRLLKKLDPSIKDQVNLYICSNEETNKHFNELNTHVDKLTLISIKDIAQSLEYDLSFTKDECIDQVAILYSHNNNKTIAPINNKEFELITYIENLNQNLRWPILIFSMLAVLIFTGCYFINSNIISDCNTIEEQNAKLEKTLEQKQKEYDLLLNDEGILTILPLYQEIFNPEQPFEVFRILSQVKSKNLVFSDIIWSAKGDQVFMNGFLSQTTIVAEVRTDHHNSFISIMNNFIETMTKIAPNYIIEYSESKKHIFNDKYNKDIPIIIRIKSVETK
jgi:hypothetical protein